MFRPDCLCLMNVTRKQLQDGSKKTTVEIEPSVSGTFTGFALGAAIAGPVGALVGAAFGFIFGPSDW